MKGKRYLFVYLVLGMVIGWALGFLRLPHVERNYSFGLGFLAALAFASLVFLLADAWNRTPMGKKRSAGSSRNTARHTFIRVILLGVLVLGGLLNGLAVYRQNTAYKHQVQDQDKKLRDMAALVETVKKNDPGPLLRGLLDEVGAELKQNRGRTLSDTLIARIAAFSFAFKPYPNIEADSLSGMACSPGRGQLLQALVLMNIDTGSFARIKRNTLFAGADLRGTDLKGLDLSGINLKGANLKDADWSGVNLEGADLSGANLWAANLTRANLRKANLIRADLSWAQLNKTSLASANLNGANLANAQLIQADLNDATFQWAHSVGALFNEANLNSVDFIGTNLTKANLTRANLNDADLRKINLNEADLLGVKLNTAFVDENWVEKLEQWQPVGGKELLDRYAVVNDTADKFNKPIYRLKKK